MHDQRAMRVPLGARIHHRHVVQHQVDGSGARRGRRPQLQPPSAITHAFVGGMLAPPPLRRERLALELAAVSALADLDVVAFRFGSPYAHPLGHRGLTHSLLFAALMALALHRDVRARAWW